MITLRMLLHIADETATSRGTRNDSIAPWSVSVPDSAELGLRDTGGRTYAFDNAGTLKNVIGPARIVITPKTLSMTIAIVWGFILLLTLVLPPKAVHGIVHGWLL